MFNKSLLPDCLGLLALFVTASPAAAVSVVITPAGCVSIAPNTDQQFTASVSGASDTSVVWMVNGIVGGAPEVGRVSNAGLYSAPANVEVTPVVTITAASVEDARVIGNSTVCNQVYARPGRTLYVAKDGSNSNVGDHARPWLTIQYAVDQALAGDTILVRGGVYNETVRITHSGSAAEGYITLTAAPGENAIIDGTGLITDANGQAGLVTLMNVSYVRIVGFDIRNYKSNSEFIPFGVMVAGSGQRIDIRDNDVHSIEANDPVIGHAFAGGIAVYGSEAEPLRNILVRGNNVHHIKNGGGESLTIGGNVEGWQVTGNFVHDNSFIGIDATGYYGPLGVVEHNRARQGWIADNAVLNLSTRSNEQAKALGAAAVGIYADGSHDITIERNRVASAEGGIWILCERPAKLTSNVTVRNNMIRFNSDAGMVVGGYDAAASGGASNVNITNNTFYQNNQKPAAKQGELYIGYNATNVMFVNNILNAADGGYIITKYSPASAGEITIGYNIYWSTSGLAATKWRWAGSMYTTFSRFAAVSGDSGNASIVASPQFADVGQVDLQLSASSPGVNSGILTPAFGVPVVGLTDYAGHPRIHGGVVDRGAYQRAP